MRSLTTDNSRVLHGKSVVDNNCLTVSQLMKLTENVVSDVAKLELLKYAWPRVYDLGNFNYAEQILDEDNYKEQLLSYITPVDVPLDPVGEPIISECAVDATEFAEMQTSLENISFSSSRESQAKSIIRSNCLNAKQVKDLLELFSFESSRLSIAKYAYAYCSDPSNYYLVNDAFQFESSIEELNAYIESN